MLIQPAIVKDWANDANGWKALADGSNGIGALVVDLAYHSSDTLQKNAHATTGPGMYKTLSTATPVISACYENAHITDVPPLSNIFQMIIGTVNTGQAPQTSDVYTFGVSMMQGGRKEPLDDAYLLTIAYTSSTVLTVTGWRVIHGQRTQITDAMTLSNAGAFNQVLCWAFKYLDSIFFSVFNQGGSITPITSADVASSIMTVKLDGAALKAKMTPLIGFDRAAATALTSRPAWIYLQSRDCQPVLLPFQPTWKSRGKLLYSHDTIDFSPYAGVSPIYFGAAYAVKTQMTDSQGFIADAQAIKVDNTLSINSVAVQIGTDYYTVKGGQEKVFLLHDEPEIGLFGNDYCTVSLYNDAAALFYGL